MKARQIDGPKAAAARSSMERAERDLEQTVLEPAEHHRSPLMVLEYVARVREDLDALELAAVAAARHPEAAARASWAALGHALGITRQSAHRRFTRAGIK